MPTSIGPSIDSPDFFNGMPGTGNTPMPRTQTNDDDFFQGFPTFSTDSAVNNALTNDVSPADAAESVKIGNKLGVHPEVVQGDKDHYKQQAAAAEAAEVISNNNFIKNFVSQDPLAAALAFGDYRTLDALTQTISSQDPYIHHNFFNKLMAGSAALQAGAAGAIFEAAKGVAATTKPEDTLKQLGYIGLLGLSAAAAPIVTELSPFLGPLWLTYLRPSFEYPVPELGGRTVVSEPEQVLSGFLGMPRGIGMPSAALSRIYPSAAEIVRDMPTVDVMRQTAGYYNEFTPEQLRGMTHAELRDYLIKKTGMGSVAQSMTEKGVEVPKGVDKVIDGANLEADKARIASLDDYFKKAEDVKMKKESPESLARLLNQTGLLKDKEVWVDASKIKELYQTEKPREGDELFGYIKGLEQHLPDAADQGIDIRIPMSEFLAHTPLKAYQAIRPFIRFDDNSVPVHQSSTWMAQHDPDNQVAAARALGDTDAAVARPDVLTSPEMFAQAEQAIAQKEQALAAQKEQAKAPEEPALEPVIPPEMYPVIYRKQAESNAVHGQYTPGEIGLDNIMPAKEEIAEIAANPGVEEADIIRMTGATLYGEPGQMATISLKELMQNAVDAIKPLIDVDSNYKGKLRIDIDTANRTISILDNGHGMTPETVAGPFLRVAGSQKESKTTTGGYGVAKSLTHYQSDALNVITARDGKVSTLDTSGPELFRTINDKSAAPIVRFRRDAEAINKFLPSPKKGYTRLWRGNRPGEIGTATQFTSDLPGIALPFMKSYGGGLSYVTVPTADLQKYLQLAGAATDVEFNLPSSIASKAVEVPRNIAGFSEAPKIKVRSLTPDDGELFPKGQGSKVTVKIPLTYRSKNTGVETAIAFPDSADGFSVLRNSPLFKDIDVDLFVNGVPDFNVMAGNSFPLQNYRKMFTLKFPAWGKADVWVSAKEEHRFRSNVNVLAHGLWQFSYDLKKGGDTDEMVPYTYYIDLRSDVSPKDESYPIDSNRVRFRPEADKAFGSLLAWLRAEYSAQQLAQASVNYGHMQYLTPGKAGEIIISPKKLIAPEIARQTVSAGLKEGDELSVKGGKLFIKGKELEELTPEQLKSIATDVNALKVPQKEIDPSKVILHNNVEVRKYRVDVPDEAQKEAQRLQKEFDDLMAAPFDRWNTEEERQKRAIARKALEEWSAKYGPTEDWVDLVDEARRLYGPRFDKYIFEIGDVFMRLRNAVVKAFPKYEQVTIAAPYPLSQEGVGISFDEKYHGVSIRVPFSASFVNPPVTEAYATPLEAAADIWQTMIHELAHHIIRSHNWKFPQEMQHLSAKALIAQIEIQNLEQGSFINEVGAVKSLERTYKENKDINDWLRGKITGRSADVRHRGSRIKSETESSRVSEQLESIEAARSGRAGPSDPYAELHPQFQERTKGSIPDHGLGKVPNPAIADKKFYPDRTAQQIAAVMFSATKKTMYGAPLFENNKVVKMPAKLWGEYSQGLQRTDEQGYNEAIKAATKIAEERLTDEWKKKFEDEVHDVTSDFFSRPDIIANRYFRFGEWPTGEKLKEQPKLLKSAVDYMAPKDHNLSRMTDKDGVHPDDIAPTLGFSSGRALIEALSDFDRDRGRLTAEKYIHDLIADEANKRLDAKYGSMEEAIQEEAQKIAVREYHFNHLDIENRVLAAMAKQLPLTKQQFKDYAAEKFPQAPLEEATLKNYQNAMKKAQDEAEYWWAKQDVLKAWQAKQRQIRAGYMAEQAEKFARKMKTYNRQLKMLNENAALPGVAQDYVDMAHKMLNELGLGPLWTNAPLPTLEEWAGRPDQYSVEIPKWILNRAYNPTYDPEKMTIQERIDIGDAVKNILRSGRNAKRVDTVHGRADLDNALFDITQQLSRMKNIPLKENRGFWERRKGNIRTVTSYGVLVERLLDYSDQFHPDGALTKYIDRPIRDANEMEIRLEEAAAKKIKTMWDYIDGTEGDRAVNEVIKDGNDYRSMTRHEVKILGTYMGDKTGIEKVTKGLGITEDQAWGLIVRNLKENDIKWLNTYWELRNDLWKYSSALQERFTGVAPDPIEARPQDVILGDGKTYHLTGGYTNIEYDPTRGNTQIGVSKQLVKMGSEGLFGPDYIKATTPRKHFMPRTEYTGAVDLTGNSILQNIKGVIHDIAFREATVSVYKIIHNDTFAKTFIAKWGEENYKLLPRWLDDIIKARNFDTDLTKGLARFLNVVNDQTIAGLIGNNPGTGFKHLITTGAMTISNVGFKNLAAEMIKQGPRGVLEPLRDLLGNKLMKPDPDFAAAMDLLTNGGPAGQSQRDFIYSKSAMMRARAHSYPDTIAGSWFRATQGGVGKTGVLDPSGWARSIGNMTDYTQLIGRSVLAVSDWITAGAEWTVAYNKALARGAADDDAVAEANRAVVRAHGSNFIGDKPEMLRARGTPLQQALFRSITALMNIFMHLGNDVIQIGWDMHAAANGIAEPGAYWWKKATQFGYSNLPSIPFSMLLYVLVPVIGDMLWKGFTEEDDDSYPTQFSKALASYLGSMVPIVNNLVNAWYHGADARAGLYGYLGHEIYKAYHAVDNIYEGKTIPKTGVHDMGFLLFMLTRLGANQIGRTMQGAYDWSTGVDVPHGFTETARQLITGYSQPYHKPLPRHRRATR